MKEFRSRQEIEKKELSKARGTLNELYVKRSKVERPIRSEIENLLQQYNTSAAAYHGGKLNGVHCCRLMQQAKLVFQDIQEQLVQANKAERCDDEKIIFECRLHRDICLTLDTICSKLRMKHGEPRPQDYIILQQAMGNLHYLWSKANLNYTPKIHTYLKHAIDQMRRFNGIGDMLEDDVEHIHQKAAKIESRIGQMKNKEHQSFVHSRLEAMQNSREIKEAMECSITLSKRKFKKQNLEYSSVERKVKARQERDFSRMATLSHVATKPHESVPLSNYEKH